MIHFDAHDLRSGFSSHQFLIYMKLCNTYFFTAVVTLAAIAMTAERAEAQDWRSCQSYEDVVRMYPERVELLFEALDLERPDLSEVRRAWSAGEKARACSELVEHFMSNEAGEPYRLTERNYNLAAADRTLEDELIASGDWFKIPRQEDGGINWSYRGPPDYDNNQMGQINRHSWMLSLLFAGYDTGEAKYQEKLDLYLRDWSARTERHHQFMTEWNEARWPRASDRKLNAGIRMRDFWPTIFYSFLPSEHFSEATKILMLAAIAEHGEYLRHHHAHHGNHLVMQLLGLMNLTVAFPEFKKASDWQDHAVAVLGEQFREQMYPEGVQKELAANYHLIVVRDMEFFSDLLERSGREADPYYLEMVEKGYEYLAFSLKPNGESPMLNDVNAQGWGKELLVKSDRYDWADWRYVVSHGEEGERPDFGLSIMYPWSGRLISRSGWSEEAQWSVFDIGPHGIAHQHNDKLHLAIHALGRDLLVDSGRYTYKNYGSIHPRDLRGYVRRSWGHNVIIVDHQSQNDEVFEIDEPAENWKIAEEYDFALGRFDKGWYGGIGGVHERALVYLRDKYWLVVDRMQLEEPGTIQVLWHLHPDSSAAIQGRREVVTINPGEANLRITPVPLEGPDWSVSLIKGQRDPYFQGWYSPVQNKIYPSICAQYEREVEGSAIFAWVMTVGVGQPQSVDVEILRSDEGFLRLKIKEERGSSAVLAVDFDGNRLENHHEVMVVP